jgi:predicted kinase
MTPTGMTELVILIGIPGSGKTTWYRQNAAATHVHVSKDLMADVRNKDTLQQKLIGDALMAGQSVVVDNTNPTAIVRAALIALGKRHGARVIGYFFDTPPKVAFVRNKQREGKARVPDAAVFVTAKKLVRPEMSEGFDELHVIAHE